MILQRMQHRRQLDPRHLSVVMLAAIALVGIFWPAPATSQPRETARRTVATRSSERDRDAPIPSAVWLVVAGFGVGGVLLWSALREPKTRRATSGADGAPEDVSAGNAPAPTEPAARVRLEMILTRMRERRVLAFALGVALGFWLRACGADDHNPETECDDYPSWEELDAVRRACLLIARRNDEDESLCGR